MAKDKAARDKEAEEEEERRLSNPYKRGEVLGPIAILCEPANSGKSWMRELVQNINKLGNVHQENFNCEVVDITKPRKNPDEPLPYGLVVSRVSDHGPEEVKQANLEWMIKCDDQEIPTMKGGECHMIQQLSGSEWAKGILRKVLAEVDCYPNKPYTPAPKYSGAEEPEAA